MLHSSEHKELREAIAGGASFSRPPNVDARLQQEATGETKPKPKPDRHE